MIRKIHNRLLACLMMLAMLCTLLPAVALADGAATSSGSLVWNGSADTSWYTANPTARTFTISTPTQLAGLSYLVNATQDEWTGLGLSIANPDFGTQRFVGKTITLASNLWLNSSLSTVKGDTSARPWQPIGGGGTNSGSSGSASVQYSFGGTFDGAGKTVYNVYIDKGAYSNDWASNYGFFGLLAKTGTIKNLTITGFVDADRSVGGILGKNWGTVENCVNYASVKNYQSKGVGGIVGANWFDVTNGGGAPVVRSCINYGAVQTAYPTGLCGGIAGDSEGILENCANYGSISSVNPGTANIGGITGNIKNGGVGGGTVKNSFNAGTIFNGQWTAGVVAQVESGIATILNCYNIGNVTGGGSSDYAGGILGNQNSGTANITNCYNTGTITAFNKAGAIAGKINAPNSTVNLYYRAGSSTLPFGTSAGTAAATSKSEVELKSAGFAALLGGQYIAQVNAYPILTWQNTAAPTNYSVTTDSAISGGIISVNPTSGIAGTVVTVSVTPNSGKQLAANSLKYSVNGGSTYTAISASGGVYSFPLPAANVIVTARFEDISVMPHSITKAAVPDPIWTITLDKTSAAAGESVTVTVADTAFTSWATGLVVTGLSGTAYGFSTVTPATGNANNVNGAGVYKFVMPAEPVTVNFTADYTPLNVYVKVGSGAETLVHSYSRAEMNALAAANTSPVYYAMWDRLPTTFMGKAVRYVPIQQIVDSAKGYNSAVRFDDSNCTMKGASLDGWTLNLTWDYLMGTTRQYYAALGDPYLAPENRTGVNRKVPAVLAITGWAGRQASVDNQSYDTLNSYRFFYGLSATEYADGSVPTSLDMDARCTANNSAKFVNKLVFVVPQSYRATADGTIRGGSLAMNPTSGIAGDKVTVSVTPDSGNKLVAGSLKYTADSGISYTTIPVSGGVYSFPLPAANVTVTAQFVDIHAATYSVTVDSAITGGTIRVDPASGPSGTVVGVTVTPASGHRLVTGSLKYTTNGGTSYTAIPASGGMYSFPLPTANSVVTARFEDIPTAIYTVVPRTDDAYTIGATSDGIKTMTVNKGISGLKYFKVNISPVKAHDGLETVVFAHLRDGVQLELNAIKADFDIVDTTSAGFGVQGGDVVKVYIMDELTNDLNHNSTIFQ